MILRNIKHCIHKTVVFKRNTQRTKQELLEIKDRAAEMKNSIELL